jgi:hypothetical protein
MAIAQHHNSAKLQLCNSLLTTLYSPTPTTTTGTSSISLRASQEKLTDFQSHTATATGSEFKTNTNDTQRLHINDKLSFGGSSSSNPSTDTLKQQEREKKRRPEQRRNGKDFEALVQDEPEQSERSRTAGLPPRPTKEGADSGLRRHFTSVFGEPGSPSVSEGLLADHPNYGPSLDVLVLDTVNVSR